MGFHSGGCPREIFSSSAEMMNRLRPRCAPGIARKIFSGTFTLTSLDEVIPKSNTAASRSVNQKKLAGTL